MPTWQARLTLTCAGLLSALALTHCAMLDHRAPLRPPDGPTCFVGLTDFSVFSRLPAPDGTAEIWISPPVVVALAWNELVVSWNAPAHVGLTLEASAWIGGRATDRYNLGHWAWDTDRHRRTSVNGQQDSTGEVQTDTLVLRQHAQAVQLYLTLRSLAPGTSPNLKFLGLSFLDNTRAPQCRPPHRAAWGRSLPVPEKAQLDYPGGRDWCSPTCVAMVLGYWAEVLGRPELAVDVPEAARRIHDPGWGGTGNWVFNTAFAGSFDGLRAFVIRFDDLTDVERWISAGVPVVLSVSFDALVGRGGRAGTGHLVVCVGFTETGDVIVNDPWTGGTPRPPVRRVYPRARVIEAWSRSRQAAYLIYPETFPTPPLGCAYRFR
jgi:hypothetical protein